MTKYRFTALSDNIKTGPMPNVYSDKTSCPDTCLFIKKCYPNFGPANIWWSKTNDSLDSLIENIGTIKKGKLWRYGVAGDLPGNNRRIDKTALRRIIKANKGKRGFTYTHKPLTEDNIAILKESNNNGFTINVSCDTFDQVRNANNLGLPAVVVLPRTTPDKFKIDGNIPVLACPVEKKANKIQCIDCGWCAMPNRSFVVGFHAHGNNASTIDKMVANNVVG